MDIKQLEAFVNVARHNSFSKAADAIFLTQPTISAHIHSLENELGVQLLVRSTKKVHLTKTGKEFFAYAQNILTLRDEAFSCVLGNGYESRGEIDVLASTVPAQYLLPEVIAFFHKQYPHIVFRVHQADSRQVIEKIPRFQYDFGLVGIKVANPKLHCWPFYDDTLVVILPKTMIYDQPQSDEELSKLLSSKIYVMREEGSGTRAEMASLLAQYGVAVERLRTVAFFNDNQSILNAVSHGLGIAIISKIAASEYVKQGLVNMIEIDKPSFHRKFYLLTKNELQLSPIQQAFADVVRNFYQKKPV